MLRTSLLSAVGIVMGVAILSWAARIQAQSPPPPEFYVSEPAVSPDSTELAFVSGGDIWSVAARGGEARLLVSHPATESKPVYSPDGRQLAFVSTRTGDGDIYVLDLASGRVRRLTADDGPEQLNAWSRDGRWIYFSSTSRDIGASNDIYRVSADGGTSMVVSGDRYVNEYFSAPSPNSDALAVTARGAVSAQWWRKGRSHIDESEIWLRREGTPPQYEPLTGDGEKALWPMWAADGRTLFYVSDRSGPENIWARSLQAGARTAAARQLTRFTEGRVLWPSIGQDGRLIAFERDFRLWTLDTATNAAQVVRLTRRGAPAAQLIEHLTFNDRFQELSVSDDGRKLALVVRGEIFAAGTTDGGAAIRITRTPAREFQITWSPDSRKLAYVSARNRTSTGPSRLQADDRAWTIYQYDFTTQTEQEVTDGSRPLFSSDGKQLAFVRSDQDRTELHVVDLATRRTRRLAKIIDTTPPPPFPAGEGAPGLPRWSWSPDGQWIAYPSYNSQQIVNVHVVNVASGDSRQVSFLGHPEGGFTAWTPDGKALIIAMRQRTNPAVIARVDLTLRTPQFREDEFRRLFNDPPAPVRPPQSKESQSAGNDTPPAPRPAPFVFEGIRDRLRLIPVGVDTTAYEIAPDGKTLLLLAEAAGQENVYAYSLDELATERPVARQITSTPGAKTHLNVAPNGKDVYYLEQGRVQAVNVDTRQVRRINVSADMDVDFEQEKLEIFHEAWSYLRLNFFDAKMNGVDWAEVRQRWLPFVAGSATRDELRRLLMLMIGELNASHLGVRPPGPAAPVIGKIGVQFDRAAYDRTGALRVSSVIPLSPAAVGSIQTGDSLTAIDGLAIDRSTDFDAAMANTIGRRIVLRVRSAAGEERDVPILPIAQAQEKDLRYRDWVRRNREYVAKASGGRLGYIHMPAMSPVALAQLYLDIDAENRSRQGVVFDIRNNNGGFVAPYALDTIARRDFGLSQRRGAAAVPSRSQQGQPVIGVPTVLVTNQSTLSDGENFTQGYQYLKLGKVVGEPTAGWVIGTADVSLVDGTVFRLPGVRWTTLEGSALEMQSRPVDVAVKRTIGEDESGKDSQLDAAVRELLQQLGSARSTN